MSQTVFKLESLLETHEQPFVVINADLTVVAVNQAWESVIGSPRIERIGTPCCLDGPTCRHKRLFQTLEPYAGIFPAVSTGQNLMNVRGYPLLDADGRLYLGESLLPMVKTDGVSDQQNMIGGSAAFQALKIKLQQAAMIPAPVLLTGETGTGKELAADFVHHHSQVAKGEFVIADCTIFGEDLFESELFGHEKGAFTGATVSKKGLFELADNGTLFLDEIGELPLSQQAKLLRAMESGQFRRVGGTTPLKATVRVVCATHRNLAEMVRQGRFREDLFYRLSVFPIEIPPLRNRGQDVVLLIEHFCQRLGQVRGCQFKISDAALRKLLQHDWPGNIRELKNCLQLATGLCVNNIVQESDVHFMHNPGLTVMTMPSVESNIQASVLAIEDNMSPLEKYEANFIADLISKYQGNRKLIAAEMNISERTLYRKLNKLRLT
jgi:DNA-binding NtrC family response regulator